MNELEIEVFRAGNYGEKGEWSENDLAAIAADYNPDTHEAPVTIDHAQRGPALGWVKSLRAAGPRLFATIYQMSDRLRMWLNQGAFKKRSIELYPAFNSTGRPYIRALSFLGAAVPEVKGMNDPLFSDEGADVLNLPFVEEGGAQPPVPIDPVIAGTLFAENEKLRGEVDRLKRKNAREEILAACRELERSGRLLPHWYDAGLVAFLESLSSLQDSENESDTDPTPYSWFLRFLQSLPPLVPLSESAPASLGEGTPASNDLAGIPHSTIVDSASIDRHRRAAALCKLEPALSYAEALLNVSQTERM